MRHGGARRRRVAWSTAALTLVATLGGLFSAPVAQAAVVGNQATVTASSQNTSTSQQAAKAVDGVKSGYPNDYTKEWATVGQRGGAWIKLAWTNAVWVDQIVLYDRPNTNDRVMSGTLTFDDGTTVAVGALTNSGGATTVASFGSPKKVSAVTFTVGTVSSTTENIGLMEFEVLGSASAPSGNQAPTARAGTPRTVMTGTAVTLDGSGSSDPDGTIASWKWTQTSGPAVTLANATTARPSFTPATAGTYAFSLVVTDDDGAASASSSVTITAEAPPPTGTNLARYATPTASSANTSTTQTPAKAVDGVVAGYPADYSKEWATIGGKAGSWLQLAWTTPSKLGKVVLYDRPNANDQVTGGTLTFSNGTSVPVGALDNAGAPVTVTFPTREVTWVRFTVGSVSGTTENVGLAEMEAWEGPTSGNWPPSANAGADQFVMAGAKVTLDGSKSSDAEGTPTYAWTQTGGPSVTLTGATTATPAFTAPTVTNAAQLTFTLTVKDGGGLTATDTVMVTVTPPATLSVAANGSQGVFTLAFGQTLAGRAATLQVEKIATTTTTENPTASWQTAGTVTLNSSGGGVVTVTNPYDVTHTYRAVVTVSGVQYVTNTVTFAKPKPAVKQTDIPTMYLNTNERAPINSKDIDLEGTVTIAPGTKVCTTGTSELLMSTSGRGNYTWELDKKPYNVKLDKKASLCGMDSAKKWALLANHYDRSLLRTSVAMSVGARMDGLAFTPQLVPVDLFVNGTYLGAYNLIERVEVNSARVNVPELKGAADNVQPNITGGYLMEWDFRSDGSDGERFFQMGDALVTIKSPQEEDDGTGITDAQENYIVDYMNRADDALFASNFTDPTNGWRKYIDEKSAVDFYLLQEYTKNLDSNMFSSVYVYKTRDGATPGKLYFGPVWDFDTSLGAATYEGGQGATNGWYLRGTIDTYAKQITQGGKTWLERLNDDPAFRSAVQARWKQLEPTFQNLAASGGYVDQQAAIITKSANANFSIWDPTEVLEPGLQVVKGSWSAEVSYLKQWMRDRNTWITNQSGF